MRLMADELKRFETAHARYFSTALAEIKSGRKRSHWMWYIFPQVAGLGFSETSKMYAIKSIAEATAFLAHPVLGKNLEAISSALLSPDTDNASLVFGHPDDMKLQSCMTLFSRLPQATPVFQKVLDKYFGGKADVKTIEILNNLQHYN